MAGGNVETRLFFQKCKASNFPNHDGPQPLSLALQEQGDFIHGEVSKPN